MTFWLPVVDPNEPPIRVMALHSLAYCSRLYYLEEVEEIRVADERVYAGRQLHSALDTEGEPLSLEMTCPDIGLSGKVDCLKRRDGSFLPYEHKRGKARRNDDNEPEAWKSDKLQVIAYALLIESTFGQTVYEGRIRYHADNVSVKVSIDQEARNEFLFFLEKARTLRKSIDRPPIADNPALCERCSLAPVCLPEESRLVIEPERDITRLFPADRDGASIHVATQGAKIGVSGEEIIIQPPGGEPEHRIPSHGVESVVLHGSVQVSTQAIRRLAEHGIAVHWMTVTGFHHSSLVSGSGKVQRRLRQYAAMSDGETRLRLSKALVAARVDGQYRYLLRASRKDSQLREKMTRGLDKIAECLGRVPAAESDESLRGLEGMAAATYFSALDGLINDDVAPELRFGGRNRRPPLDRFNALLGYGYGLVHSAVMGAVLASGLEPALGFYHKPRSAAHPLVLDLMELFRLPVWDMTLVASINRNQWDIHGDFEVTKAKVWLSERGRKKAISLFENRMQETWKHPVLDYSLSYGRSMELEARLLEKEWTGEPGLFAQSRLR